MIQLPLVEEIPPLDPFGVLQRLFDQNALFLDSAAANHPQGRYSFIACDPFSMLHCKNGRVYLNNHAVKTDFFSLLQQSLKQYPLPILEHLPPFQGGIAGMLGYELGSYLEKLPARKIDDLAFEDSILGFYDIVFAWDHKLKRTWVFSSGYPSQCPKTRRQRAAKRLKWAISLLQQKPRELRPVASLKQPIESTFTQKKYEAAVQKVIQYIRAGDIFQANIAQRFSAQMEKSFHAFDLYGHLRKVNPAPFAAYLQFGQHAIVSASPERFLQLRNKAVEARPIKGTCARHEDPIEDQTLANALLKSEKDRAENIMIVDLMRNDLSRVCTPHTVLAPQLCALESFTTVHHLVSVVTGILDPSYDAVDLLKATFPGGSVTGAPKIRAMEIINEIEPTVRGPYCGSIGYMGFNGEMDLSITIRTFVINQDKVTFHAGGAVTVDSCPTQEYQETLIKAKGLSRAILFPF